MVDHETAVKTIERLLSFNFALVMTEDVFKLDAFGMLVIDAFDGLPDDSLKRLLFSEIKSFNPALYKVIINPTPENAAYYG